MTSTYQIQGMCCENCTTHIQEALIKVEGVNKVSADLERTEAVVEAEMHIPVEELQKALKNTHFDIVLPK